MIWTAANAHLPVRLSMPLLDAFCTVAGCRVLDLVAGRAVNSQGVEQQRENLKGLADPSCKTDQRAVS